jgi:hypothetical protein
MNKSAAGLFKPWKFDNITEKQFYEMADTGDLLLYKSNSTSAAITRTFTNSHFDHVGMVLKFETDPNEIYIVDATGNLGVSLNKWSFLRENVGHRKFYERVVFRHIKFNRSEKMIENLEVFLKEAIGQRYEFSSKKFFRRNTYTMGKESNRELIDE